MIVRFLRFVSFALLGLLVVHSSRAGTTPAKRTLSSHALVKVARASVKVAAAAPKITAVGVKDTIGAGLFAAEAVVDVIHAGTTALNDAANLELKKNPFKYVDEGAAWADTGLEKAYLTFFGAPI